jgi:hypothetical protein
MPTTLPLRIAAPARSSIEASEADGSVVIIFLVASIGMLLSVLAAIISPDWLIGL